MYTTSHVIYNLGLLSKKSRPDLNPWIIVSSLIPDIWLMFFVIYYRLLGYPFWEIFDIIYFQEGWRIMFGLTHSLWLWPLLWLISSILKKSTWKVFFAGISIHALLDFWVHTEDAYYVLSPFLKWGFNSPFSYYDLNHSAWLIAILDLILLLIITPRIIPKFKSRFSKNLILFSLVFSLMINLSLLFNYFA